MNHPGMEGTTKSCLVVDELGVEDLQSNKSQWDQKSQYFPTIKIFAFHYPRSPIGNNISNWIVGLFCFLFCFNCFLKGIAFEQNFPVTPRKWLECQGYSTVTRSPTLALPLTQCVGVNCIIGSVNWACFINPVQLIVHSNTLEKITHMGNHWTFQSLQIITTVQKR